MKRREFIKLLSGVAAAWPLAARAQQALPVIGFLSSGSSWETADVVEAFRLGLRETGYVEGRSVVIEYRYAEGHYDRLPVMAADLFRRRANVIAAMGTPAAPPANAATSAIPIVFRIGVDPVELGLVASLSRPGGNLTGVVSLNVELEPKRLEILHELVPGAAVVAALINPSSPNSEAQLRDLQAAGRSLGLHLNPLYASSELELAATFEGLMQMGAGALVISSDPFFDNRREQITALALQHRVPAIAAFRDVAAAGALVSYGGSNAESYRVAGTYTGRVLKGENPADLPIQQLAKIELIINLKTAKALGLTISETFLARADEVIE
jgi:putative tryptophan/tyrosine transport system substrate-binding protein